MNQTASDSGNQQMQTSPIPFYVISPKNVALNIFRVFMSFFIFPNVLLNVYIIAFGFEDQPLLKRVSLVMDLFFLLEIIQNFFTAYRDPENFEYIPQIKKIAYNYIVNGDFITHLLAFIPYINFMATETEDE